MSQDVRGTDSDFERIAESGEEITYLSSNELRQRERGVSTAAAAVDEADILATIWSGGHFVTASGVASALDVSRETALSHLRSLCDAGALEREPSGSGRVWHLPVKD